MRNTDSIESELAEVQTQLNDMNSAAIRGGSFNREDYDALLNRRSKLLDMKIEFSRIVADTDPLAEPNEEMTDMSIKKANFGKESKSLEQKMDRLKEMKWSGQYYEGINEEIEQLHREWRSLIRKIDVENARGDKAMLSEIEKDELFEEAEAIIENRYSAACSKIEEWHNLEAAQGRYHDTKLDRELNKATRQYEKEANYLLKCPKCRSKKITAEKQRNIKLICLKCSHDWKPGETN